MKTNNVTLIGYVGDHLKSYRLADGTSKVCLRVVTSQSATTNDGRNIRQSQWHDVVAFDDQASYAENNFLKGSHIMVSGLIEYRTFLDKAGHKRYFTEIRADELINLDR